MNPLVGDVMNSAWAYRTTRCVQKFDTCLNYRHPCGVNLSPCLRSVFCKLHVCLTYPLIHDTQPVQTWSSPSWISNLSTPCLLFPEYPARQHAVFSPEYPACQYPFFFLLTIPPKYDTLSSRFLITLPVNMLSSRFLNTSLSTCCRLSSWITCPSSCCHLFLNTQPVNTGRLFRTPSLQHPVVSLPATQHVLKMSSLVLGTPTCPVPYLLSL